jgi:hypothetical protein
MVFGGEGVQLIQVTFLGSQILYFFEAPPRVFEISPTGLFLFFIWNCQKYFLTYDYFSCSFSRRGGRNIANPLF